MKIGLQSILLKLFKVAMVPNIIKIRGARHHNLKNIDLDIPHNQLVVITGLSGSGKSTLAFDTLYAEGQRRYVESLTSYARQFLERMPKPDVDSIDGLSPAIAIEQKQAAHNPRSTVGTVTEIYDYLRLLYARIGKAHCHQCGRAVVSQTVDQMVDTLLALSEGTRIIIMAPLVENQKGSHSGLLARLRKDGFARVRVDGSILEIEAVKALPKKEAHTIEVVVDRIVRNAGIGNRLSDSLELAMGLTEGRVMVLLPDSSGSNLPSSLVFSEKAACPACGISYPEFTPASFSFNSPQGACPQCDGLGVRPTIDPDRIVPDPKLSLAEGAVHMWANRQSRTFNAFVKALAHQYGADLNKPFETLPAEFHRALFYGSGDDAIRFEVEHGGSRHVYDKPFEGLVPQLKRRYRETDSPSAREEIRQYFEFRTCAQCLGTRLKLESRSVRLAALGIHELTEKTITDAIAFFRELHLDRQDALIAGKIIREILQRLEFLEDVGLDYLSLNRAAHTLSGGESQRIHLATQIGAKLTGVLYVLDEPSVGLHKKDTQKLLQTLLKMRDQGNSVVVVEHDAETIMASDFVIDMGPAAGANGGRVVFHGPPQGLGLCAESLTGAYFSGRLEIPVPARRRSGNGKTIIVSNAVRHNLKGIEVAFPLGCLVCVTGVSGSGKSTLVVDTLLEAFTTGDRRLRPVSTEPPATFSGLDQIDKIIDIDQSPIGRTPRSNPATYTGVFNPIRDLFSRTADARMRGYKPSRFSFNVKGGRCEACRGDGLLKIEMHFLPDIYVPCDVCGGRRYNRETLEVRYKGSTIAEILDMTVNQAFRFFEHIGAIRSKLQSLIDVGLGYIRLGQTANTLSGGEAQRVKLARELGRKGTGRTLYILDEPTTGLHMHDINTLLQVLNRIVDQGNSVIVIEHNLDVIKSADHIIDLGPEGGNRGGYIMGTGTPETIAQLPNSYTGQYLAPILNRNLSPA
jgi:excinuclease ABC subunit A